MSPASAAISIRKSVRSTGSPALGLGGDHEYPAYERDEPDEEKRLDEDLALDVDQAQRVEQLGNDEEQQDAVEDEHSRIRDRTRVASFDDVDDRAYERVAGRENEERRDRR